MNRIVLATLDTDFDRRLRLAVGSDAVELLRPIAPNDPSRLLIELTAGGLPNTIVFGPGVTSEAALTVSRHLDQKNPGTCAVVLATGLPAEELLIAMRSGVRDIVVPDAEVSELREVMERATAAANRQLAVQDGDAGTRPRGRVIPVISPKGGCGKTTVATNLAVGLARLAPHSTVIVDLDLQFGDVGSALQLAPEQGLSEAAQASQLDALAIKTFLTPHPSGLLALCAPDSPAAADAITSDDISRIIELLATEFRYVVIDTSPGLVEETLAALDSASDAVMVCGMDVPSIRGLHKEIGILRELGLDRLNRHIVLNFADRNNGLTVKDVETVIGATVDLVVPRSSSVPLSTNRGVPLVQDGSPRDPATKSLQTLVGRFQVQLKKTSGRGARHRAAA